MCAFGVGSQYRMSVSIGNREDFLTEDKFIKFIIIDNIGLSLPYWELQFDCVFPDLLKYMNEKQIVSIKIGRDINTIIEFSLVIKKPIIKPVSADCVNVTLRGFLSILQYLELEKVGIYENKTTKDLAQIKAKDYGLQFVSNIDNTKDLMTYYQPYYSDYKFLFTEWLHSYTIDGDIIIPTITASKKLTYNSLNKLITTFDTNKNITFTDSSPSKNEILVDANQIGESNTIISNSFGNYVKSRYIFDINSGICSYVNIENNTPIISESKTNSVDESISKTSGFFVQSSNVHKNYYKQELINTQKWFSIQTSKQWVSSSTIIKDIEPGNLVMYMNKKSNNQINDQISGLYLVSKRVLSIKNRTIKHNFLLTRENMNYSK